MKKTSRISVLIISLALIAVYFLPVWEIELEAPQYPEGLGMNIWINKITGDLNTINGLNHYIGMKTIQPDSIKELTLMPYILGALILLGISVVIAGRKKLLLVWVIFFMMLGIAGGVDFYLWEYDYGHNLNPEAAIKIPGMSYQPPLIGSKQLANFTAYSIPDTGGIILIGAGIASLVIMLYDSRKWGRTKKRLINKNIN
ncbi:MAG: hypothetical protein NTY74_04335 [Ignavibacteriae bacterium]|nr:hypothetical protein [Ignavibacteriota bacterium]